MSLGTGDVEAEGVAAVLGVGLPWPGLAGAPRRGAIGVTLATTGSGQLCGHFREEPTEAQSLRGLLEGTEPLGMRPGVRVSQLALHPQPCLLLQAPREEAPATPGALGTVHV